MRTAETILTWSSGDLAARGTVLALEILDETSRLRRTLALPSDEPRTLELPHPRPYLARGWLPDGTELSGTFHSGTPRVCLAPRQRPPGQERALPSPAPGGLWLSLLGYLHVGDLRSARILAEETDIATADDPLQRIALTYLFFDSVDHRFAAWAKPLVHQLPNSPDAAILAAWAELESPDGRPVEAGRELLRALDLGPPVVARGISLLADGLLVIEEALAAEDVLAGAAVRTALSSVRRFQYQHQRRLRMTPLTGDPGSPLVPAWLPDGTSPVVASPKQHALPEPDATRSSSWSGLISEAIARVVLPLLGPRAAGSGQAPSPRRWAFPDHELTLIASQITPGEVCLDLTATKAEPSQGSLFLLDLSFADRTERYLMAMVKDGSGGLTGHLVVRGASATLDIVLWGHRAAQALGPADVPAIRRSVGATNRQGRNQWRALARARAQAQARIRASDDPVLIAIRESLP
ncbi:MAG: hypothetical protein JXA67_02160 [Micromonosporaceae bacterium]|nr:hypothetical protein [Micromonosporaceae bacterium]